MKIGAHVLRDRMPELRAALRELANTRVMVGIPSDDVERDPVATGKVITVKGRQGRPDIVINQVVKSNINNAELGYVHEFGSPASNIPARPFLIPGLKEGRGRWERYLRQAAEYALKGDAAGVQRAYHAAGLAAQAAVRAKIQSGPFQPLSPRTLAQRKARGVTRTAPLIDTAQMRNAITYVLRKIRKTRNAG